MTIYHRIKTLSPALVVISRDGDDALWSEIRLRKPTVCANCSTLLQVSMPAFHPVGNQGYRYERLCRPCVAAL